MKASRANPVARVTYVSGRTCLIFLRSHAFRRTHASLKAQSISWFDGLDVGNVAIVLVESFNALF